MKITTCQTIQVHNLSASQVVSLMREALEQGIITIGGGGDNPRNVMASPLSGTDREETFDVLPYAEAISDYLLGRMTELHLPRKLKVAFSNTEENLTHANMRDLGFVANPDGTFSVYCAGGLGPNPKMGVLVERHGKPENVSLYVSAMLRLLPDTENTKSGQSPEAATSGYPGGRRDKKRVSPLSGGKPKEKKFPGRFSTLIRY